MASRIKCVFNRGFGPLFDSRRELAVAPGRTRGETRKERAT